MTQTPIAVKSHFVPLIKCHCFLVKDATTRLKGLRDALGGSSEWTEGALEAAANAHLEKAGLQMKEVAQAARVALTGRTASPGLFQVLFVLGRDASLARLDRGVQMAEASPS